MKHFELVYLLKHAHHVVVAHVSGPMPRPVTSIIAGVNFSTKTQQQLSSIYPPLLCCSVQWSVASRLHLGDIETFINSPHNRCKARITGHQAEQSTEFKVGHPVQEVNS